MNWNLEGKRIAGRYMGEFPYQGRVTESRVQYGGNVQHTVKVDTPIRVYGQWRDTILISPHDDKRDSRPWANITVL